MSATTGGAVTDADLVGAAVGIFLPLAIAAIQRYRVPTQVRALIAYAVYLLATVLTAVLLNEVEVPVDARGAVRLFLMIAVSAYSAFKFGWQPAGVTDRIERASPLAERPSDGRE